MGRSPRLFVFSGPSGVGKGTILKQVLKSRSELHLTVSATTREPRPGEVADVDYHYLSEDAFTELLAKDAFLEWADVHGHRYGTLLTEVDPYLEQGNSVILEIDVQGGFNIRKSRPDAVLVFVDPPSMQELERRLRDRATEDEQTILLRLENARREIELAKNYDVRIVNDSLDEAVERTEALIDQYENDGGATDDVCD